LEEEKLWKKQSETVSLYALWGWLLLYGTIWLSGTILNMRFKKCHATKIGSKLTIRCFFGRGLTPGVPALAFRIGLGGNVPFPAPFVTPVPFPLTIC
jgi:hypothetical protein